MLKKTHSFFFWVCFTLGLSNIIKRAHTPLPFSSHSGHVCCLTTSQICMQLQKWIPKLYVAQPNKMCSFLLHKQTQIKQSGLLSYSGHLSDWQAKHIHQYPAAQDSVLHNEDLSVPSWHPGYRPSCRLSYWPGNIFLVMFWGSGTFLHCVLQKRGIQRETGFVLLMRAEFSPPTSLHRSFCRICFYCTLALLGSSRAIHFLTVCDQMHGCCQWCKSLAFSWTKNQALVFDVPC